MRIENRMQLKLWREECKEKHQKETCRILICGGTGCLAGGSDKIYARLEEMTAHMANVSVKIGEEIALSLILNSEPTKPAVISYSAFCFKKK